MNKSKCTVWKNGTKNWYFKGLIHREDGPALEFSNGYKAWYLNGRCLDYLVVVDDPYYQKKYPKLVESIMIYIVHNL